MPEILKAVVMFFVGVPVGVGLAILMEYFVRRKTAKLVADHEEETSK